MKNKIIEILEKQEKTFWTEPDDTQRYCVSINDEDIEKVADEIVATNDCTAIEHTYKQGWEDGFQAGQAEEHGMNTDMHSDLIKHKSRADL